MGPLGIREVLYMDKECLPHLRTGAEEKLQLCGRKLEQDFVALRVTTLAALDEPIPDLGLFPNLENGKQDVNTIILYRGSNWNIRTVKEFLFLSSSKE